MSMENNTIILMVTHMLHKGFSFLTYQPIEQYQLYLYEQWIL